MHQAMPHLAQYMETDSREATPLPAHDVSCIVDAAVTSVSGSIWGHCRSRLRILPLVSIANRGTALMTVCNLCPEPRCLSAVTC